MDQNGLIQCVFCLVPGRCCVNETGCPWNRSCVDNTRTGVFCGECIEGYTESASSETCVPIEECSDRNMVSLLLKSAVTELFVPILPMFLFGAASDGSLTSLITFLQLIPLVLRSSVLTVYSWIFDLLQLQISALYRLFGLAHTCLYPSATALAKTASNLYGPILGFVDLALISVVAFILFMCGFFTWSAVKLIQIRSNIPKVNNKRTKFKLLLLNLAESTQNRLQLNKEAYFSVCLMLLIALFVPILNSVASLLNCVEFENDERLLVFGVVTCFEPVWQKIALGGLLFLCIFPLLMLIFHFILRKRHLRWLRSEKIRTNRQNRYNGVEYIRALQGGYKESRWWWECVSMSRRLVLVMLDVFVNNQVIRGWSVSFVCLIAFALHVFFRPYASFKNQFLEALYLFVLTVLSVFQIVPSVLLFYGISPDSSPGNSYIPIFELILILFSIIVFVISILLPPLLPIIAPRFAKLFGIDLRKSLMPDRRDDEQVDTLLTTTITTINDDYDPATNDQETEETTRLLDKEEK